MHLLINHPHYSLDPSSYSFIYSIRIELQASKQEPIWKLPISLTASIESPPPAPPPAPPPPPPPSADPPVRPPIHPLSPFSRNPPTALLRPHFLDSSLPVVVKLISAISGGPVDSPRMCWAPLPVRSLPVRKSSPFAHFGAKIHFLFLKRKKNWMKIDFRFHVLPVRTSGLGKSAGKQPYTPFPPSPDLPFPWPDVTTVGGAYVIHFRFYQIDWHFECF